MTQHKQSHRIKSHGRTSHHIALHQNRSHHHHGTAEGSFTAKTWFGHRAGRSPCTHSIGKFFLCYILLFSSETSAPGSPGNYLYKFLCVFLRLFLHWNEFSHFGSLFSVTPAKSLCFESLSSNALRRKLFECANYGMARVLLHLFTFSTRLRMFFFTNGVWNFFPEFQQEKFFIFC